MNSSLYLVGVYCAVLLPSAGLINFFNRKLTADLQARVGPNRAGPSGLFQPIADFLKALQKEVDFKSLSIWELLLLWIQSAAVYSTVTILPLGSLLLAVDTDMGVLLSFWAAFSISLMSLFLGLEQSSVPGWLSAVRVAIQSLVGAFPAIIALFCAGMQAGGLRWTQLIAAQGASPFSWMIFRNPFELLAFLVFVVSGLILFSVAPMDSGIMRSDTLGGFHSSLFGRRLALFNFGRFYGFFLWSVVAAALFLGGWSIPEEVRSSLLERGNTTTILLLELFVLLVKTYGLMLLVNLIVKVNPRGRVDQVTNFAWKVLSPASLFALIGCALWVSGRQLL